MDKAKANSTRRGRGLGELSDEKRQAAALRYFYPAGIKPLTQSDSMRYQGRKYGGDIPSLRRGREPVSISYIHRPKTYYGGSVIRGHMFSSKRKSKHRLLSPSSSVQRPSRSSAPDVILSCSSGGPPAAALYPISTSRAFPTVKRSFPEPSIPNSRWVRKIKVLNCLFAWGVKTCSVQNCLQKYKKQCLVGSRNKETTAQSLVSSVRQIIQRDVGRGGN
jgi:hypothetical protein